MLWLNISSEKDIFIIIARYRRQKFMMDGYLSLSMPHLTLVNNSYILTNETDFGHSKNSTLTLTSFFTVVGSSLSLVGLVFAFITYSLFSDLRTVLGTSLMNLFASLFLSQLLFVIGAENPIGAFSDHSSVFCMSISLCQHYLWLSTYVWIAVMIQEMYRMFKQNISLQPMTPLSTLSSPTTSHSAITSYVKYCLCGWGLPCLSLICISYLHFCTDYDSKFAYGLSEAVTYNCWIIGPASMFYGLIIPTAILLIFDVWTLLKTLIIVRYTVSMQVDLKVRKKMKKNRSIQMFLYAKIVTIFYISMLLASLTFIWGQTVLWYPFVILNSMQGVVVSLIFTCNAKVFKIYSKSIRKRMRKQPNITNYGVITKDRGNDLSRSSSLALLTLESNPDVV